MDYYGILNVSRDSDLESIRAAYRRHSSLYHPDKHQGETSQKAAQDIFTSVSQAYSGIVASTRF
jgi:DnaJ-class molecular chaperone